MMIWNRDLEILEKNIVHFKIVVLSGMNDAMRVVILHCTFDGTAYDCYLHELRTRAYYGNNTHVQSYWADGRVAVFNRSYSDAGSSAGIATHPTPDASSRRKS